jgi:hypothetical protein
MKKFYYLDNTNNRIGPISKEDLLQLNLITNETLIWHEGLENWKTFKVVFDDVALPPPPPSDKKIIPKTVNRKFGKKILIVSSIALVLISSVTFGFFSYRNSLIENGLNQFKLTGHFEKKSLKSAYDLSSEYAGALLGLSYKNDDDTLEAEKIFNSLKSSTDWRVIAISNHFFEVKNPSEIDVVNKGIEEEVIKGNWFWTYMKGMFIINEFNGYKFDKSVSSKLFKYSADAGCGSAMRRYADQTDDMTEKCIYYQKLINSDYERKDVLSRVYCKLAEMTYNGSGCKADDKLFFNYASKASELGDTRGFYLLGIAYQWGKGTNIDGNKAFINYSKAADKGDVDAIYYLSLCYKNGFGVVANSDIYKEKLNLAADKGNTLAINEKEELRKQEAVSAEGGNRKCICCGQLFNLKYGWGYSRSKGPYLNGENKDYSGLIYGGLLKSMGFSESKANSDIEYCKKQCAWDCGSQ